MKKIAITLTVILILIQFIRPERNNGNAWGDNDLLHYTAVPENVKSILENSCNDCHSNHSEYPWYTNIQPLGFWIQHHINEGKEELNFSEFMQYKPKRQKHKMEEIVEMIREGEMPLESYTLIHKNARLNDKQKQELIQWAESVYKGINLEE